MILPPCMAATPIQLSTLAGLIAAVLALWWLSPFLARVGGRLFFAAVAAVFLASRLGWLLAVRTLPVTYYFHYGCEIARGLPIPDTSLGHYHNWWAYTLFLGLVFRLFWCSVAVGQAVTVVLGAATIPPLYLVAERCAGKTAARWTVVFFVLWPAQLMFTSAMSGEHLALPLAFTGFYFGLRLLDGRGRPLWNAMLSGLALTLAMIVRPDVLAFAAPLGLILLFRLRPWKRCAPALAVLAATYLAVDSGYAWLFQRLTGGKFTPGREYSASVNLLYGWNYNYAGGWSPEDFQMAESWPRHGGSMKIAWAAVRERVRSHGFRQTVELLRAKDRELWGEPRYAFSTAMAKLEKPPHPVWLASPAVETVSRLYQLLILTACLAAAVKRWRGPPSAAAMTLPGIIIFGTLLHLVLVVSSRYSHPFMPVLFVFAAVGFGPPEKRVSAR